MKEPTWWTITDTEIERSVATLEEEVVMWADDDTTRSWNFDRADLLPAEKLVIGYLTLEKESLFETFPPEEQAAVLARIFNA
jgi:hypothetical protein